VPARLEALGVAAGLDRAAVHSQVAAALDAVVHLHRGPDGVRRVVEVAVLDRNPDGTVRVVPAATRHGPGPAATRLLSLGSQAGSQ
jgi:pilus assembly protein CpaF